jgi:hypothetical protein
MKTREKQRDPRFHSLGTSADNRNSPGVHFHRQHSRVLFWVSPNSYLSHTHLAQSTLLLDLDEFLFYMLGLGRISISHKQSKTFKGASTPCHQPRWREPCKIYLGGSNMSYLAYVSNASSTKQGAIRTILDILNEHNADTIFASYYLHASQTVVVWLDIGDNIKFFRTWTSWLVYTEQLISLTWKCRRCWCTSIPIPRIQPR